MPSLVAVARRVRAILLAAAAVAALPVAVFLALPAAAAGPNLMGDFKPRTGAMLRVLGDCAEDRANYCAGVPHGGGRIVLCLADNLDRLSESCLPHIVKVDAMRVAWEVCRPDVLRYCSQVVPGRGRVVSCLAGNIDRLSPQCRTAMRDARSALAN